MQMYPPESFYASYRIAVQPEPRPRWLWVESLLAICCWIRSAIRREREIRRGIAELENLSDHLLRDIGISRHDIRHVVRQSPSPLRYHVDDPSC